MVVNQLSAAKLKSAKLSDAHSETQREITGIHAIQNVPDSKIHDTNKFLTNITFKKRGGKGVENRGLGSFYILIDRNVTRKL